MTTWSGLQGGVEPWNEGFGLNRGGEGNDDEAAVKRKLNRATYDCFDVC